MAIETLYKFGIVTANIGQETEDECEHRLIGEIKSLKDVFNAVRMPHMIAMDQIGEVTFSVFVEQAADLNQLKAQIDALPGVTYSDLTPDLVRHPKSIPCGQPGHQCSCAPKTPKP